MATDIAWVLNHNPKYEGCVWFISGEQKLKDLNWGSMKDVEDNEIAKPTQKELDDYFKANKAAYDSEVNVSKRKYPLIAEQLDMLYWYKVNETTTWQDAIAKVKSDNPKE